MATVFMKWLETTPGDYDRGIELLTLGRLQPLKECIAREYTSPGDRVLEIGCGTGGLALLMAQQGARVTAVDASEAMLVRARRKASSDSELDISFFQLDVTELGDRFEPDSFDLVVSTLVFSELRPEVRRYALEQASRLLAPGGRLLIADEIVPAGAWQRLLYWAVRLPLTILTWLLTRTGTRPLRGFEDELRLSGFIPEQLVTYLGGSLQLFGAYPVAAPELVLAAVPRLRHRTTIKTLLLDLLSLINRMVPPYPKIATGLYRIGNPDRTSPVLATGNYELTVRRLVRALDGAIDCWLVVANSRGINVWCAAGGGHFGAGDIIAGLKTSGVMDVVDHHALILPQLCANGVDGWRIRQETGWGVHWGPIRAEDIPAFLAAGRKKIAAMRQVHFPLRARLEMTTILLTPYGLLLLIPSLIFWRPYTLPLLALAALLAYFYGAFLPWIPGRDGVVKGAFLAGLTVAGLWFWTWIGGNFSVALLLGRSLGLGFLAFFIGAEFQGMSPLMRGEQANWSIEGIVGLLTLVAYGLGRLLFGGGQ
ncbi:MAG: methyltransferase domain-containing protein [Chloroflexota bacterium]|jgi:SAM-dependent methyltransferase